MCGHFSSRDGTIVRRLLSHIGRYAVLHNDPANEVISYLEKRYATEAEYLCLLNQIFLIFANISDICDGSIPAQLGTNIQLQSGIKEVSVCFSLFMKGKCLRKQSERTVSDR